MPGWSEYSADKLYDTIKKLNSAREYLDYVSEALDAAGCPVNSGSHTPYAEILAYIQERKDQIHRLLGSQLAEKFAKAEKK